MTPQILRGSAKRCRGRKRRGVTRTEVVFLGAILLVGGVVATYTEYDQIGRSAPVRWVATQWTRIHQFGIWSINQLGFRVDGPTQRYAAVAAGMLIAGVFAAFLVRWVASWHQMQREPTERAEAIRTRSYELRVFYESRFLENDPNLNSVTDASPN